MTYHHGNLKESLIQAANEALNINGIDELSLRDIAKRAGVSHNAPYRHFRDRVDLLDNIIERTLCELAEQILSAPLLYPASIRLQIQFVGRLFAQLAIHHAPKAHLLFGGLSSKSKSTSKKKNILAAGYKLLLLNIESILEPTVGHELKNGTNCKELALLIMATFRGLGVLYATNSVDELLTSEDVIFDFTDMASENLLHHHLA
ncbi:MAG: hypothetical protein A2Z20_11775 [Bdellovibrionales bacterium RBG_16_40_8]|nr:MAG: hypothetical protein A2Z20_11775 [Bdellovibrionales bacterium RBG_16_40_8]